MKPLKTEPIDADDHHMTLELFLERCDAGDFIDYDGFGHYATETELFSSELVYPSDVLKKNYKPKPQFTHVVWYNK